MYLFLKNLESLVHEIDQSLSEMKKMNEEVKRLIQSEMNFQFRKDKTEETNNDSPENDKNILTSEEKIFYVRSTQKFYNCSIIVEMLFDIRGLVIEVFGHKFIHETRMTDKSSTWESKSGHKLLEIIYGKDYEVRYKENKFCYIVIEPDERIDDDLSPHLVFNEYSRCIPTELTSYHEDIYKEATETLVEEYKSSNYSSVAVAKITARSVIDCLMLGPIAIGAIITRNKIRAGEFMCSTNYLSSYGGEILKEFELD